MEINEIKIGGTYLWHGVIVTVRRKYRQTITVDTWHPFSDRLVIHRGIDPATIQLCRKSVAND